MNIQRRWYIEKIASEARNKLIEEGIVAANQRSLNENQWNSVVRFYCGRLVLRDKQSAFIAEPDQNDEGFILKVGEREYTLQYCLPCTQFPIIFGLGCAFLHLDQMKVGETYHFNTPDEKNTEASLFARAFIMPRSSFFESVAKETSANDKCNVSKIADAFNIDCLEVLARGYDLNIWNHRIP